MKKISFVFFIFCIASFSIVSCKKDPEIPLINCKLASVAITPSLFGSPPYLDRTIKYYYDKNGRISRIEEIDGDNTLNSYNDFLFNNNGYSSIFNNVKAAYPNNLTATYNHTGLIGNSGYIEIEMEYLNAPGSGETIDTFYYEYDYNGYLIKSTKKTQYNTHYGSQNHTYITTHTIKNGNIISTNDGPSNFYTEYEYIDSLDMYNLFYLSDISPSTYKPLQLYGVLNKNLPKKIYTYNERKDLIGITTFYYIFDNYNKPIRLFKKWKSRTSSDSASTQFDFTYKCESDHR